MSISRDEGNKEAMERGFFDLDEAMFVEAWAPCLNPGAFVEHGSWFVSGENEEGDEVTYSVHACSGPESITFEEL